MKHYFAQVKCSLVILYIKSGIEKTYLEYIERRCKEYTEEKSQLKNRIFRTICTLKHIVLYFII